MTVLHVLDHSLPLMSGYSTRSSNIVQAQVALGLRPVVVTSPRHGYEGGVREILGGVPHYRTPMGAGGAVGSYLGFVRLMARLASRLREVARAEGADVLHAHSPVLNGLPALWVGRRLGLKVVYESRAFWEDAAVDHGTTREGTLRYRLTRALETFLFKRADHAVVISEGMRRDVLGRGVAAARITVVPNGVDGEWFRSLPRSAELAARLGVNGGPVLGFVGSFYRYEGLDLLLQALPALRDRVPRLTLLLVGAGEQDARLRALAARLDGGVVFAGRVGHDRVRDFYSLIDVFVCPRRRLRLTELVTPLKPLEAMAMRCPVLASDVGGQAELIRHGETGMLFPAESREALVSGAAHLLGNPALRADLAERAREFAVKERSWTGLVARYVPLYREAAS